MRRTALGVLVAGLFLSIACVEAKERKRRYPNLTFSGSATLSLQASEVSQKGAGTVYAYDTYYLRRKFQKFSSLRVSGELLPHFKLDANLSDWGYSGLDKVWTLTYEVSPHALSIGDMTVSVGPGPMVLFSRRLKGLKIEGEATPLGGGSNAGPFKFTFFRTRTRAETATDVLRGTDSTGPYYLRHSPIVEGSEVVKVDERVMKPGVDYTIEYLTGVLNFFEVIPSTSTITASYEYIPGRSGMGEVQGLEVKGPIAREVSLGLAVVEQRPLVPLSATSEPREEVEEFFGGDSPGPYYLTFRPIVRWSERVTIDGVLQERERDYTLHYTTGMVMFTKFVPSSSLVVVRYLYRPAAPPTTPGKRVASVELVGQREKEGLQFGLAFARSQGTTPSQLFRAEVCHFQVDPLRGLLTFKLPHPDLLFDSELLVLEGRPLVRGRDYTVDYEKGEIRLLKAPLRGPALLRVVYKHRQTSPPPKGSATALFVNMERKLNPRKGGFRPELRMRASFTNFDPDYQPVESTAYSRNETGLNLSADYMASPKARFSLRLSRRKLESGIYGLGALEPTAPKGSVTSLLDLGAQISPSKDTALSLSIQRNSISFSTGSHSYLQAGLRAGLGRKGFQLAATLDLNQQESSYASRQGTRRFSKTRTLRATFGGRGSIGGALDLSVNLAASRIRALAGEGRNIKSHSLFVNATYTPADSLSASLSLALNQSIGGIISGWYSFAPLMPFTTYGYGPFSTPTIYSPGAWSYGGPWTDVGGLDSYGTSAYPTGWGASTSPWESSSYPTWRGRGRQIGDFLPGRRSFSSNLKASVQYTPTPKLSLSFGFDAQVYRGASVMGEGWSRNLSAALGYGLGRNLDLDITSMLQETFYVDIGGIMKTKLLGANLDYSPPGRPRLSVGFHSFLTRSPAEEAPLGGGSGRIGSRRGTTHELVARLTWPLKGRFDAFAEFNSLKSTGAWAHKRREVSAGVEYKLSEPLRLVGKWQLISYRSLRNPEESYRASIFGLQLRAQF